MSIQVLIVYSSKSGTSTRIFPENHSTPMQCVIFVFAHVYFKDYYIKFNNQNGKKSHICVERFHNFVYLYQVISRYIDLTQNPNPGCRALDMPTATTCPPTLCPEYDIKNHPVVRLQFFNSRKYAVTPSLPFIPGSPGPC